MSNEMWPSWQTKKNHVGQSRIYKYIYILYIYINTYNIMFIFLIIQRQRYHLLTSHSNVCFVEGMIWHMIWGTVFQLTQHHSELLQDHWEKGSNHISHMLPTFHARAILHKSHGPPVKKSAIFSPNPRNNHSQRIHVQLVGGFNPFEKHQSNWITSPSRGENKTYLKASPRQYIRVHEGFMFLMANLGRHKQVPWIPGSQRLHFLPLGIVKYKSWKSNGQIPTMMGLRKFRHCGRCIDMSLPSGVPFPPKLQGRNAMGMVWKNVSPASNMASFWVSTRSISGGLNPY